MASEQVIGIKSESVIVFTGISTIMAERGEDLTMAAIPGGRTGLMVRDYVTVRTESGKIGTVATYAFDRGLFAELRAVGEQIARELGQWMPETASERGQGSRCL
jgi:hypothetical protein